MKRLSKRNKVNIYSRHNGFKAVKDMLRVESAAAMLNEPKPRAVYIPVGSASDPCTWMVIK